MSKPYDQGAPPQYPQAPPPIHHDAGPAPGGMQPSYYNQGGGAPDYYGGSPNPYQQGQPGPYGPPPGQYGGPPPQGQYGYGGQQMQYQQGPPPPGGYYQDDRRNDGGGSGGLFAGFHVWMVKQAGKAAQLEPLPEKTESNLPLGARGERLNCDNLKLAPDYFRCVCAKTNSLGQNWFFSAHCILQECTDDDKRRAFIKQYQEGCSQTGDDLRDIPNEWAPFVDSPPPSPSLSLASTAKQAPFNSASTSAHPKQPTQSTGGPTTTSLVVSTETMDKPTITPICMTKKPQGEPSCRPQDLDCICKASASLENNTEFDQQCVLEHCFGDIGREEFLDNLVYHCEKVDKQLTDIPKRWEPYLPPRFPTESDAPTSPSAEPATSTPTNTLSTGAIAGTVVAAVIVLIILIGLVKLYWDTKKKAKKLRVANAQLQDATNPDGASRRITALLSGASSRRSTPTPPLRAAAPQSPFNGASAYTYNEGTLINSPSLLHTRPGYKNDYAATTAAEVYPLSELNRYNNQDREFDSRTQTSYELPATQVGGQGQGQAQAQAQGQGAQHRVYDDSESDYESVRRLSWQGRAEATLQEEEALLIKVSVAQERDPYCQAPSPPLALPDCTIQCLIGKSKLLDANCADNLRSFCRLDIVALHFKEYGKCILDACPSKADRQDYVNLFQDECARKKRPFNNDKVPGVFNYEDLLSGTPSSSLPGFNFPLSEAISRSTSTAVDIPAATSMSPVTTTEATVELPVAVSSSKPDKPAETSQPAPPASSNLVTGPSPTKESGGSPSVADNRPLPNESHHAGSTSQEKDGITAHVHTTVATTVDTALNSTPSHEPEPAFGTAAIAGTAAGGTAGIALIIGAIYLFMRRRKRRASIPPSRDIWSPTRNTQDKPELDGDAAFDRYSDSKAELHSGDIPSLPVLPPTQDPFSDAELEAGVGPGSTNSRYYHANQQRLHHHQPSSMDSRYPSMHSYTSPAMAFPTSPVSAASTIQGWHPTPLSSAPAITLSHAEPSSERARSSVVSERRLEGSRPLRLTRSVELHGVEGMAAVSELATGEGGAGGGNADGAVELHNESATQTQFGEGEGVGVGANRRGSAVEMDGEGLQRQDRVGCGY
ncbi:hypothetical protein DDE83_008189 [Stemphylium lycopersici]|uniref:Uncharacterized protein n=1 Tax=Stemphylium lycopersici TaxID=183478 RepID=A0A364MTX9_STELY|nr:hypothetical protein DDE83_008189 [Stemphylium lycopersici]